MIKRIILLFMVASAVMACDDINYDSETRLVIEGQLIDKNGNAIPNQDVDIAVYDDDDVSLGVSQYPDDVISFGSSDATGKFKLIIPAPKGEENTIGVRINRHSSNFQHKEFLLIRRKDFINYRFNLNQVKLYQAEDIATLTIYPNQTHPDHELKKASIEGSLAEEFVYVNPIAPILPYSLTAQVLAGQTVTVRYEVIDYSGDGPVVTEHTVDVVIGSGQTTNYTLNY